MPAVVNEFVRAAARRETYALRGNPYLWFGFAWGLPVPLFSLAVDGMARGQALTPANAVAIVAQRPHHLFFLLHPLLFAWLFAVLGSVRSEKDRQVRALIEGLEQSLRTTSSVNAEMRRLQGVKEQYLAQVTHELKNPLSTIRGYAEMLLGDDTLTKDQREAAEGCVRNVDGLTRMINDMLAASALDAGLLAVDLRPCDLGPVADATVRALAPVAARRKVRLAAHVTGGASAVADARRLEHVLVNLVGNALRYVASGGSVTIVAEPEGGEWVRVAVKDDGCGIPPAEIARLGERYHVARDADGRKRTGTGLGLNIVKGILKQHGTTLDIDSAVGKGTTMSFRLRAGRQTVARA